MDVRGLLRDRVVRLVALVVAYVAVASAGLLLLGWTALPPAQRQQVGEALAQQVAVLVALGLLAAGGLAALLWRTLGAYPSATRRLAADVRLLLGANPDHRVDRGGPPEVADLAEAVEDLAERRRRAEREVSREVAAARADVEHERNRLAALMADLSVAVLVCSTGGRILLYNNAARTLLADDPALALGRSVFGIVDRGLVTHALDRIQDGQVGSHVSTAVRDGTLLQVRLAPVRAGEELSGFVLVLEDTGHLQARRRRDALLRSLVEEARASLASIRAAVETIVDYPEMAADELTQFVQIIHEESRRLGDQVERWVADAARLGSDWFLTEMSGEDVLTVLVRELERSAGVTATAQPGAGDLWLKVDSHALARALAHLASRLHETCTVERITLSLTPAGSHGRLTLEWKGRAPDADLFRRWLEEPLPGGAAANVSEVVERHDAEVWTRASADDAVSLRLLLPLAEAPPRPEAQVPVDLHSRPEFYDFDLFDRPEQAGRWDDRLLSELAYAVFDTETTGFHPDAGDEVISIGGVHVVNGRLRRHEVFEQLVDPLRPVPATSSAVHGITTDMVRGQPPLEQVLPAFARFAEDMVLVGHNVSFDMGFFRAREARTGVRFTQPVLDTLLLDAALHPDHEQHSLEAIAARLGVDVIGRHTALGDALLTGEVFVRLLALLQQRDIRTLGQALEASRATYQSRMDARLYGESTAVPQDAPV